METEPRPANTADEMEAIKRQRDGLAAALGLLINPLAEKLHGYYRDAQWRKYDSISGTHSVAKPYLSIGSIVALLDAQKDAKSILAAHDRQVAARVLREFAPLLPTLYGSQLQHVADAYGRGEREVPGE